MMEDKAVARKPSYVGAPAIFKLELACRQLCEAFNVHAMYHVGSSLTKADWRDVDLRLMLSDVAFDALFPDARGEHHGWESDPRWLLMTTTISSWLSSISGLPVDFQFQRQTNANARYPHQERSAMGMHFARESARDEAGE